jgi:hypothetical protein
MTRVTYTNVNYRRYHCVNSHMKGSLLQLNSLFRSKLINNVD